MGVHYVRRVSDLGEDFVLAPERFDPRRQLSVGGTRCLADYVDIVTDNATVRSLGPLATVLVLDTTHAYEGFVIFRHEAIHPADVGSAKRWLHPGDVIISRLRPYLRQVAYVDPQLFNLSASGNGVLASTEFFVLRQRPRRAGRARELPPAAFVPFLLSEAVQSALAAGQEGGHHPRFSKELLETLPVADVVVEDAEKSAAAVAKLAHDVRHALARTRALVATVDAQLQAAR